MKEQMTNELAYNILIEIEIMFLEHYGKTYITKLTKSDDHYTFCTNNFILTYSFTDLHFYLTFMAGQYGNQVSYDTKLIMLMLDYSEFTVMEDSHFDKEKQQLVFGFDAIDSRQKEHLKSQAKTKCPICEKIYSNEFILENGLCKWCDQEKDKMVWN